MRYRRFRPLLAAALSVAIGAGAISAQSAAAAQAHDRTIAASANSEWEEVPLNLSNPSPSLTMVDLERLAEQAARRPLPPIKRAVVYGSDQRRQEEIESVLAGRPDPAIRIYKDVPTAPTTTLKDLTSGVPVPQDVIPIPIPYCVPEGCMIIIVLFPI